MSGWRGYELTIGMQHMVPNRLSEVELLKWLGAYQWEAISRALGRPENAIESAQGDRLYASFVDVELCFPPARPLDAFDEGTRLVIHNRVRSYASRFVEGLFAFDSEPIAEATLAAVSSRTDLVALPHPWASLTTAFVARAGSNSKLKVFEPIGMDVAAMPVAEDRLAGITDHQAALSTGQLPSLVGGEALPIPAPGGNEVLYEIMPEHDLNGAGLLYFARYVAMMNYAERILLSERLARPLSRQLVECLAVERRRVFYFTNADAGDRVRIFVDAAFVPPTAVVGAGKRRSLGQLVFRLDLHRASDGALMASSVASKSISVSGSERAVVSEVDRLRARLARAP